jgi:multiple sugar transport system permease protein
MSHVPLALPTHIRLRQRFSTLRFEETLSAYLFLLPSAVVVGTFVLIPIVANFIIALTEYSLLAPPSWVGLENVTRFFGDARARAVFRNSTIITLGAVLGNNLLGFLLAMAVNRRMPGIMRHFYRTALFFPVLTTTASFAMVWRFILTKDRGIMNWLLGQVGIAPIPFLSDPQWALFSVIVYDIWKACGWLMVLYLAGLQGIPEHLYEAAMIDGAGGWQLTRHVTLPLITPTAFFCLIMSSIGAFQIFDNSFVLTEGGPADATRTVVMYIYEMAFKRYEMGYAATVALFLLVILVALTAFQFWGGKRWVHYE